MAAASAGLGIGVASLAFDVFDNSIKLFRFLSSMVDMPKECEQYRLQLMIEYNRLLAWGDAVGLIQVTADSNVAENLGTNAVELCGIVCRIEWLLGEFRDINARWKDELNPYQGSDRDAVERKAASVNVVEEVSSLAVAYEQTREERKRLRRTKHIIKWLSKGAENAKEIITHPIRARWVMVDKEAFAALLKELHSLIERMHELMGDYRGKRIQEMTEKVYQEMVLVRSDIGELREMFNAVTELIHNSKDTMRPGSPCNDENDETLRDLLRLKEINSVSETILLKLSGQVDFDIEQDLNGLTSVRQYAGDTLDEHFTFSEVAAPRDALRIQRPRGVLKVDGRNTEAWIEWRKVENTTKGSTRHKESRLRTATLAQMLHNSKPRHLYTPTCIGYIDDYETSSRYGWIFEMPHGSSNGSSLRTLHSILGQDEHKPTLAQRMSLAWKLASTIMYLHTANWLHKGVHSENILFSFDGEDFAADKPIFSGFEFSRPQSNETTSRSLDATWDIYRWPRIQNEAPNAANSRKTYDIYSLGLVLLEIAHWKPLHELMCLKRWPQPSAQHGRIRKYLLGTERPPFKGPNPLLALRDKAGDKYWKVVERCLVAHGEFGMLVDEESDQSQDSDVGIKLQKAFTNLVLEELKGISI